MGMLKSAFGAICRIHSQAGFIKRLGTTDIYSPMRITPSNYFRYIDGPSQTVATDSEGVIPVATIAGQKKVVITLDAPATDGTFDITLSFNSGSITVSNIAFDIIPADLEALIRGISPDLAAITIPDSFESGANKITINFIGVKDVGNTTVDVTDLIGPLTATSAYSNLAWPTPPVKRGDRIIISAGTLTINEVVEMPDLGGETIGYRVKYG